LDEGTARIHHKSPADSPRRPAAVREGCDSVGGVQTPGAADRDIMASSFKPVMIALLRHPACRDRRRVTGDWTRMRTTGHGSLPSSAARLFQVSKILTRFSPTRSASATLLWRFASPAALVTPQKSCTVSTSNCRLRSGHWAKHDAASERPVSSDGQLQRIYRHPRAEEKDIYSG
jgi:hypothetical protein